MSRNWIKYLVVFGSAVVVSTAAVVSNSTDGITSKKPFFRQVDSVVNPTRIPALHNINGSSTGTNESNVPVKGLAVAEMSEFNYTSSAVQINPLNINSGGNKTDLAETDNLNDTLSEIDSQNTTGNSSTTNGASAATKAPVTKPFFPPNMTSTHLPMMRIQKRKNKKEHEESAEDSNTLSTPTLTVALPAEALDQLRIQQSRVQETINNVNSKIESQKKRNMNNNASDRAAVAASLNSASKPVDATVAAPDVAVVDSRSDLRNNFQPFGVPANQKAAADVPVPTEPAVVPVGVNSQAEDAGNTIKTDFQKATDGIADVVKNDAKNAVSATADDSSKLPDIVIPANTTADDLANGTKALVQDENGDYTKVVNLPPLKTGTDGKSNSQSVLVFGDKANATVSRTSNSVSVEAHNIL